MRSRFSASLQTVSNGTPGELRLKKKEWTKRMASSIVYSCCGETVLTRVQGEEGSKWQYRMWCFPASVRAYKLAHCGENVDMGGLVLRWGIGVKSM